MADLMQYKDQMEKVVTDMLYMIPVGHTGLRNITLKNHKVIEFRPLVTTFDGNVQEMEEYIEGTVNANFLAHNLEDGYLYAFRRPIYDPKKWQFYIWEYAPHVEESYHMGAYNPETNRFDVLHMSYTAPDNWWVDASTFLI